LRFFVAMDLHAPYALLTLIVVLLIGLYMTAAGPATGLEDAVGMLMFVQMFLASSGFSDRARRGHFDPLLTFANGRSRALAAHWMISSLPGLTAWLLLVLAAIVRGSAGTTAVICGTAAAMFIVSAVAWAAGFTLARGTAGFLWTAALFVMLVRRVNVMAAPAPLSYVFCPFLLMKPVDPFVVLATVLIAAVVLLCVWRRAPWLDIYLLERA